MMKSRLPASVTFVFLCLAAGAFGRGLSFQEHAAVQESLARVHPKVIIVGFDMSALGSRIEPCRSR